MSENLLRVLETAHQSLSQVVCLWRLEEEVAAAESCLKKPRSELFNEEVVRWMPGEMATLVECHDNGQSLASISLKLKISESECARKLQQILGFDIRK